MDGEKVQGQDGLPSFGVQVKERRGHRRIPNGMTNTRGEGEGKGERTQRRAFRHGGDIIQVCLTARLISTLLSASVDRM